jgi:hypothetical protein
VAKSTSAKKVARLAQRGKGKKVRFQGGSVFPAVVLGVVLAGLGLIAYSRATVPGLDAVAEADRQVTIATGFYLCDEWIVLDGVADPATSFADFGVADLGGGVTLMNSLPADGSRGPRFGNFLDAYGVQLNDTRLRLPEGAAGEVLFEEGTTKCDGSDALLSVITWTDLEDPGSASTFITAFPDLRLTTNGMVVAVAFTPRGTSVPLPPSTDALAQQLAGPTPGPAGPGIGTEIDPDATDTDTEPETTDEG